MKEIYIKCPKCELNYITKKEKLCPICKQKMAAVSTGVFNHEKLGELGLCPICKINYITEDEIICSTCYAETDLNDEELMDLYGRKECTAVEEETGDGVGVDGTDDLSSNEDDGSGLVDEDLELLNVAGIDNEESLQEEDEDDTLLDLDVEESDDEEEEEEDEEYDEDYEDEDDDEDKT